MNNPVLVISKDTRKLWRLQTSEKYILNKLGVTEFEVFTRDLKLKANVSTLGTLFLASCEDYTKVDFHKLKNYCALLSRCHLGI